MKIGMYLLLIGFLFSTILVDFIVAGTIIYFAIVNKHIDNYVFLGICTTLWFSFKPRPFSALKPASIRKFCEMWKSI